MLMCQSILGLAVSIHASNEWNQFPDAGWSPRSGFQMATVGSDVLVFGGTDDPGRSFNDAYRLRSGLWYPLPFSSPMWNGRSDFGMSKLANGTLVLTGGQNQDGGHPSLNDVWVVDATEDLMSWHQMPQAPWTRRVAHSQSTCPQVSGYPERTIITGGGNTRSGIIIKQYTDNWAMAADGSWTQLPDGPWHKRWLHSTACLSDGSLVLAGGHSGFNVFNDVWMLSPNDEWTELSAAAPWSKRSQFGMVAFPDDSLLIGGDGNQAFYFTSSVTQGTWTSLGKPPFSERSEYGMTISPNGTRAALIAGGTLLSQGIHNYNDVWEITVSEDGEAAWAAVV